RGGGVLRGRGLAAGGGALGQRPTRASGRRPFAEPLARHPDVPPHRALERPLHGHAPLLSPGPRGRLAGAPSSHPHPTPPLGRSPKDGSVKRGRTLAAPRRGSQRLTLSGPICSAAAR